MKRILLLLLLLTTALCACTATAEEAPAADTEAEELTLFDVRYYFEHRLLPQRFYKAPEDTMESLRDSGLYDLWCSYATENDFLSTYQEKDFSTRDMSQDSGMKILMLEMPRPEDTLLCYRIYLCVDPASGTAAYSTAEYDEYEGYYDEGCLICGWNPDGTHQFFTEGRILPDEPDSGYESGLAEEAAAVLELMRQRVRPDE